MTILDAPLGAISPGGRQDAYLRMLAWETTMQRRRGLTRLERYFRSWNYFTGENIPDGDYIQPLAINFLKVTCEAHAAYLWGQWEPQGNIVTWSLKPRSGKGDKNEQKVIENWLIELLDGHEETLYSSGLNQSAYGDAVLRPRWSNVLEAVVPESILPEQYHCRWSAHDISEIRETIISYHIAREEALEEFGTAGDLQYASLTSGFASAHALYWEYWTPETVEKWIDNVIVSTDRNPFSRSINGEILPGIIPFTHIPNVRAGGEYYGTSDIESVLELQDELNRKTADAGDTISLNSHPIVLITNYFGKVSDLPVGPDAIWDMGRDGDAKYLSGDKPPVDINVYLDRILAVFQDLSYMPAAAFGRSETAQASALALAMEMMPVTNRVNWKRLHWKQGLVRYAYAAAKIQQRYGELPFKVAALNKYRIEPMFAPVLPKDRAAEVVEQVSLVTNGIRSTARALEVLGEKDVDTQVEEIYKDLGKKAALGMKLNLGGANARGSGGSDAGGDQKSLQSEGSN